MPRVLYFWLSFRIPTLHQVPWRAFAILKERIFYGWVIAGAGLAISLVGLGARYCFGVFFNSLEAEFALTRGATSSIFSMYMLLCCVFAILGGWALDRYGPRKVCFLMGSFTGLSLLLTSQTSSLWQLYITYGLLLSLGTGAVYPVVNSTTSRWFERKRGLALGITTSGGGVGAIVMAPFATYLITHLDWRTALIIMGFVSWLVIAMISMLMRKEPGDVGLLPDGANAERAKQGIQDNGALPVGFSLRESFRVWNFWVLWFVWLFLSLSVHLIFVHVVPYAVDMGFSLMDAAGIVSMVGGLSIMGRVVAGRISDVAGRKPPAIACALLQVGAFLWLIWARELWMLYVFAIAFGFLWGGLSTMVTALIGDVFGMRSIGVIMGTMSAGWALGAAIGPAIGGYTYDVSGHYVTAFGTAAAVLLVATFLAALVKRGSY
jgi:MFS family permease